MPQSEQAYYRKCIELRRRINEIEEHNDMTRIRIRRLNRAVMKMRLERAFLLEQLADRMEYNVEDSDRSDSPPPTPQEKPLRSKRSHRKATPPPGTQNNVAPSQSSPGAHAASQPPQPASSAQSTPDPNRSGIFFAGSPRNQSINGSSSALPPPASATSTRGRSQQLSPRPHGSSFDGSPDERRPAQENGDGGQHVRAYADGAAGEMLSTGPEVRTEANGDRRMPADTEMPDADPAAQDGAGVGFTAVNR